MSFSIGDDFVVEQNRPGLGALEEDYAHLGRQLGRRGIDIERLTERAMGFRVAVPSWGVGTGGTRFARFPGPGEPRSVFEKLDDCEVINRLVRVTPAISLHIPWDKPESSDELKAYASERGLFFDSMNSNTFQDQPGQELSYKFGSLSHTDAAVRKQAVEHNLECIEIGKTLGARSHTVWVGDGGNFPGQVHIRRAVDRYLDSMREVYAALPDDWRVFIEHKLYEPAFYSTLLNDWGISYYCARELGPKAFSLVDLGHHAPNVNIEMIVARLIQMKKLAGFHFNDSKYGDDDLDAGSIKPFQLFLVFNELVEAEIEGVEGFDPAYMLDQSHNVTDPIESLMTSAVELVRAYVQAHLVDRVALHEHQERNDALQALQALKQAFTADVDAHPGHGPPPRRRGPRPGGLLSGERLPAEEDRGATRPGGERVGHRVGGHRAAPGHRPRGGQRPRHPRPPRPRRAEPRRGPSISLRAGDRGGQLRWPFRRILDGIKAGLARAREVGRRRRDRSGPWASTPGEWTMGSSTPAVGCSRTPSAIGAGGPRVSWSGCSGRSRERRSSSGPASSSCTLNTLYQLHVHVRDGLPAGARRLLMIPDLCHHALCGSTRGEYTDASTTQLLDVRTRTWADDLFSRLGLPRELMPELVVPGTDLGELRPALQKELGLGPVRVLAPATHDTASAVVGTPLEPGWAYVSSGHLVARRRGARRPPSSTTTWPGPTSPTREAPSAPSGS